MRPTYTISQAEVSLSASRPVCVAVVDVNGEVHPHDHDYYEISIVLEGTGEHHTESYRRDLCRGSILAVPPGGVHALRAVDGLRVVNLYYLAEWLLFDLRSLWDQTGVVPLFLSAALFRPPVTAPIPHFLLPETTLGLALDELDHLRSELGREAPSMVFLKAALLKLFIRVSRAFPGDLQRQVEDPFRPEIRKTLEAVEEGLMENRPPSTARLARAVHLSPDGLSRLFRETTGGTINDYYQRRRVHLACNLLLNPAVELADVVFALGYSDAAHFCRLFKRYIGLPPRAWRQQYLTEENG